MHQGGKGSTLQHPPGDGKGLKAKGPFRPGLCKKLRFQTQNLLQALASRLRFCLRTVRGGKASTAGFYRWRNLFSLFLFFFLIPPLSLSLLVFALRTWLEFTAPGSCRGGLVTGLCESPAGLQSTSVGQFLESEPSANAFTPFPEEMRLFGNPPSRLPAPAAP